VFHWSLVINGSANRYQVFSGLLVVLVRTSLKAVFDNIFIDTSRINNYSICPIINRLSDHDAQSITLNAIILKPSTRQIMEIRKFDKNSINDFLTNLSYETWDITISSENINIMFNTFLGTYLKIFYSSFLLKKSLLQIK
jgi:hypothetical protein